MKLAKKITTAAALVAALLAGTAPKAAAQCPYTVGPLGRYIAPAIVQGMTATDAGGVIDRAGPSLIRTDPAGDPVQRAGSRAGGGKMGKRKRPGQTARRALLLWPLVCTGGNGSGGVRPGAGGGADLLAVPVGMVSAGTVPAGGVPASRLALAVLHPGQFCRLPEGSDSPPNGSEKQV